MYFSALHLWWCSTQEEKEDILHREFCQLLSRIMVPRPLSRRKNWKEKKNEDQCFLQRTGCKDWLPARLDLEQCIPKRKSKLSSSQPEKMAHQWKLFFWLVYFCWKMFQIKKKINLKILKWDKQMNWILETNNLTTYQNWVFLKL